MIVEQNKVNELQLRQDPDLDQKQILKSYFERGN